MRFRQIETVTFICAATALASSGVSRAAHSSTANARSTAPSSSATLGSTTSSPDCATSGRLVKIAALSETGHQSDPVQGDGLGRLYTYDLGGVDASEVTPPPNWDPVAASAAALRTFGYPPRPILTSDLATWQAQVSRLQPGPVGLCQTDRVNSLRHSDHSPNWAGGMSVNGTATVNTYTSSNVKWYQTGFDAVCPQGAQASGYATWSGLGGWNSDRLLQSGTDASKGGTNRLYAWYELLDHAHQIMRSRSATVSPSRPATTWVPIRTTITTPNQ